MKTLITLLCLYTFFFTLKQTAFGEPDIATNDEPASASSQQTPVAAWGSPPKYYISSSKAMNDLVISSSILSTLKAAKLSKNCDCISFQKLAKEASKDIEIFYTSTMCKSCSCTCEIPTAKSQNLAFVSSS